MESAFSINAGLSWVGMGASFFERTGDGPGATVFKLVHLDSVVQPINVMDA